MDLNSLPSRRNPFATRKSLINRDAMLMVSRKAVANACVSVFDRIQGLPRAVQMVGLAAAFSIMCAAAKVRPSEVGEVADRVIHEKDGPSGMEPQFRAMEWHVETELMGTKEDI